MYLRSGLYRCDIAADDVLYEADLYHAGARIFRGKDRGGKERGAHSAIAAAPWPETDPLERRERLF